MARNECDAEIRYPLTGVLTVTQVTAYSFMQQLLSISKLC